MSPIDVISHVPFLCEEVDVSYIYVTSRVELGAAGGSKRPTSVLLVKARAGDSDYDDCVKKVTASKPVF